MATRVKMLKLLQEMRGLAQITNRRPPTRPTTALALQIRHPAHASKSKQKLIIHVRMQGTPDIPHPVKIRHLTGPELPVVIPNG